MLAGRGASGRKNIFWMTVNKILEKDSKDMMIAFMKLIFKVDLQPILDESGQFDFYLLTGIGQRKKGWRWNSGSRKRGEKLGF